MPTVPVYSVVLWETSGGPGDGLAIVSPIIPSGITWVVRAVTAIYTTKPTGDAVNYLNFYINTRIVWSTPPSMSVGGVPYATTENSWVAASGTQLAVQTLGSQWQVRVTGFLLTAPP